MDVLANVGPGKIADVIITDVPVCVPVPVPVLAPGIIGCEELWAVVFPVVPVCIPVLVPGIIGCEDVGVFVVPVVVDWGYDKLGDDFELT